MVTGCHSGDKFLVQATLASMRHYCPDVPICLVADGDVEVEDLKQQYGLIVLKTGDLPDPRMRALCYGNYYAKLAPIWVGPFEHGLWIDSDALMWGDITPQIDRTLDFQIFSGNGICDLQDVPLWLKHYQFDPKILAKFDSAFDWRKNAYFCSGAFAFRRGVVPFELWLNVHQWRVQEPDLFAWGDMGMLNYCVHSLHQHRKIKVGVSDLQHLWVERGIQEYVSDLNGAGWKFPKKIARSKVAHFCGKKPLILDPRSYSRPFTIARLEHHRRQHGELGAWTALMAEEWSTLFTRIKNRASKLLSQKNP